MIEGCLYPLRDFIKSKQQGYMKKKDSDKNYTTVITNQIKIRGTFKYNTSITHITENSTLRN